MYILLQFLFYFKIIDETSGLVYSTLESSVLSLINSNDKCHVHLLYDNVLQLNGPIITPLTIRFLSESDTENNHRLLVVTRVKQIFCIYVIIVRLGKVKSPTRKPKKNRTMTFKEIFQKTFPKSFFEELDEFFFINAEQERSTRGNKVIKFMSLIVLYTNFTTEQFEKGIKATRASDYFLEFPQLIVVPISFDFKNNNAKIGQAKFSPFILCRHCSPEFPLFFPLTQHQLLEFENIKTLIIDSENKNFYVHSKLFKQCSNP